MIQRVAALITDLYRRADERTRRRVEEAALEHILEQPKLRPYFEHWQESESLREAHARALEWALAHSELG